MYWRQTIKVTAYKEYERLISDFYKSEELSELNDLMTTCYLLPFNSFLTHSSGESPLEQPPRAGGQQIRQRASGPPPFVPLSLPQCSILLHQQELALLPPHWQTGRS